MEITNPTRSKESEPDSTEGKDGGNKESSNEKEEEEVEEDKTEEPVQENEEEEEEEEIQNPTQIINTVVIDEGGNQVDQGGKYEEDDPIEVLEEVDLENDEDKEDEKKNDPTVVEGEVISVKKKEDISTHDQAEFNGSGGKNEESPTDDAISIPRFLPSQSWLNAVKGDLPLQTIMRLLKHLSPQV